MNSKKKLMLAALVLPVVCAGCLLTSRGRHGEAVFFAPPLPAIVVLETEPYYVQSGYHYHYQNDNWYYSRSRSGPWSSLPRDRYPREVRYKDGGPGNDRGRGPGHKGR